MTLVTATVRDPNGNLYTGARVEAIFINNTGLTQLPLSGSSVFPTFTVGTTDSFGAVTLQVTGNDVINPAGTQWRFSIISATSPVVGFSVNITITGSSQDISAALQAAAAALPLTSFGNVTINNLTVTGTFNNNCYANSTATLQACVALGSNTSIILTSSFTITSQILLNNISSVRIVGTGGQGAVRLTNGITGTGAACAIKINNTGGGNVTEQIILEDFEVTGNNLTGAAGNGHGICIVGTGGNYPSLIYLHNVSSQFNKGTGVDGVGANLAAAGLYIYKSVDHFISGGAFGANQYGIYLDTGINNDFIQYTSINSNVISAIKTKNGIQRLTIGPSVDMENNAVNTGDNWINLDSCDECTIFNSYFESNNGLATFTSTASPSKIELFGNIWHHGVNAANPNTTFVMDSDASTDLNLHDNHITAYQNMTTFIDLNPSSNAGVGKRIIHNMFDFGLSATSVSLNAINWQAGTHAGPCIIEGNTFGSVFKTQFNGGNAIDISSGVTGCRVSNNGCMNSSGTLAACVKVESGALNTFVSNTTTSGAGTFTAVVSDAGTNTTCVGVGCPSGQVYSTTFSVGEVAAPTGVAARDVLWGDTNDHMLKYNPNNAGEQHVPQVYRLTAQYTNSTTGFTTVGTPNIAFPVNANQTYTATCHLYYQAAATGGLNIQFTGPAAPTAVTYGLNDPVTTTSFSESVATAFSTSLGAVSTAGATNLDALVSFILINGANAGTVTLQAKSSAAVQLQIQTGSYCIVQ